MGYSDNAYFKIADGYALNALDGYEFTSRWVECQSFPLIDISVVFTGGTPAGTLQLKKSNDLQWTGGNFPTPLSAANVDAVSDAVNAPTGFGTASATVSAAGVFSLNQVNVGYHWFQVVWSPTNQNSAQASTLDIFCTLKKL